MEKNNALRQRAEVLERELSSPDKPDTLSPEAMLQTLHELRVHQIELEMQNEQLRQMQSQLEVAQARYFELYNLAPVAYCTVSEQGLILEANLTAGILLNMSKRELFAQPFSRFVFKEDQDIYYLHRKKALATISPQRCELRMVKPDGTLFWAHLETINAVPEDAVPEDAVPEDAVPEDAVPAIRITITDITEHKEIELKQLQLNEQIKRYADEVADLYENAPCGYHSLDREGVFQRINVTELKWLGYTWDEIVNKKSLVDLMTAESIPVFRQTFPQLLTTGVSRDVEVALVCKNGTELPVLINATALYDKAGNFIMSRSTVYNMTERKKMEQERTDYALRLETVSRHLVAAQEDSRRRLSSELHDRTSPNLAAININLNLIAAELTDTHSADFMERLEDTRALLGDTEASIREICADMRPPLLDYAGLAAALDSYTQQFARRTGIPVQFECPDQNARYSQEVESLLFRIAQEALTNCAKHAKASSVKVALCNIDACITLEITDDGIGFDPALLGKTGPIGLGVLNMREMAEVVGGELTLESALGKGTRVAVEISL